MMWPSKEFKSSAGWEQEWFLFFSTSEWAGGLLILCVLTEHGPPTDFGFEQLSGHEPVSGEKADYQRLPSQRAIVPRTMTNPRAEDVQ